MSLLDYFSRRLYHFTTSITNKFGPKKVQIDSAFENLELLSELPDFDQELCAQPLPAFPQFRKLPLELRLMVWQYSLRPSTYDFDTKHTQDGLVNFVSAFGDLQDTAKVCKESRAEFLRNYQTMHLKHLTSPETPPLFRLGYWNPEIDTIRSHIHNYQLAAILHANVVENGTFEDFFGRIRYFELVIEHWAGGYGLMIENIIAGEVPYMTNLKSFRIVKSGKGPDHSDEHQWRETRLGKNKGHSCLKLVSMGFKELLDEGRLRLEIPPLISVNMGQRMWERRVGTDVCSEWMKVKGEGWVEIDVAEWEDEKSMWRT